VKRLLSIPLRILLPVLLLSCAAAAGLISWKLEARLLAGELESQLLDEARLRITSLQATLEYHFRKGDAGGVELAVSGMATRNNVIAVFVLDRHDRIVAATRTAMVGHAAHAIGAELPEGLKGWHAVNLSQARAAGKGKMVLSQDRRVAVAYYPLAMEVDDHALRPTRNGLVVMVLNTQLASIRALRAAGRQAFENALVFGGLAAVAWVFLHFGLTHRVAGLVATTRQLASGDLTARTGIDGHDELGQVARAFDLMARRIAEDILRREQVEEELRESESRFRNVFNLQFQFIAILSPEGRVLDVNDLPLQAGGVTREEVTGQFFWETVWWHGLSALRAAWPGRLEAAGRMEVPVLSEDEFNVASGEVRVAAIAITAVKNAARELECYIVQGNDITESKRAEALLRESEARLQVAMQASNLGPWDWNLLTDKVHFSPEWKRQLGFSDEEIAGHFDEFRTRLHAEDYDRIMSTVQAFTADRHKGYDVEFRMLHKDGSYRWIHTRAIMLFDAADKPIRMLGCHLDITDRKLAENALRESQRFAESIAENSTSLIYLLDLETGRNTYSNRDIGELLGYSPAQMIEMGGHVLPTIHPEDLPRVMQHYAHFADVPDGRVIDLEYRVQHTSGDWHWVWVRDTVFNRRPDGATWQILGTVQDITERRRIESDLQAAKASAEAANRAKSEFLANMSHEIRTPMNGILGMTDLVLESELTREQRDYLGMAKTSGHTLLRLINDILDFSKIEAGKLELEAIDFSLRDSLQQVLEPLVVRARQKGLELRAEIADDLPEYLRGDPLRLRQILLNFTDNALKFTERGSVVVRVASEKSGDREHCLRFSIADTGIGVPPEKQHSIFAAFAQVDSSTTRQYGGTGLGLAIVSQIVGQMRGRVWMESVVGEGTTFYFTAWFGLGQAPPEAERAVEAPPLEETTASMRILLAEDNVINCALATAILCKRGHAVVHARNGGEAVRLAAEQTFDLILMDVQMPEMDGFIATRLIRESEARLLRHTPIAAMTAHALAGDRERCLSAGMDDYLTKPLQKAELLGLLGRAAAGHFAESVASLGEAAAAPLPDEALAALPALPTHSREELLDQLDGDDALLRRMIEMFHENTPRLLDDIRTSIAGQDADRLAGASHALLSSLGAFGADFARQLTQQLEARAHVHDQDLHQRLFEALEYATADVHATLAAFVAA
jgi:PAS domain S-box-containing protein